MERFQSTLPVRGATEVMSLIPACQWISIHAPRAGSDSTAGLLTRLMSISIHAPRAGSDVQQRRR